MNEDMNFAAFLGIEFARGLLQFAFRNARLAGLTQEQIEAVRQAEEVAFHQNTPDKLPGGEK